MMQRVFDIYDKQDMKEFWRMLPDHINKIKADANRTFTLSLYNNNIYCYNLAYNIFNINWHGETEITRPTQQATKADIGKLCKFWDFEYDDTHFCYSVLKDIGKRGYITMSYTPFNYCRRLTKQEIEELC